MPTSTALLASAFVSALGLNTHFTYTSGPYTNTAAAKTAIAYLGIKNLRDCPQSPLALTVWPDVAAVTGAKFDLYLPSSSPTAVQISFSFAPQLAAMGILNYVEGVDEPDTPYPLSVGNSISYSAAFQQQVYAFGKNHNLSVINLSVGAGWTADDGWQGDYDIIGNLAAYADYANAHTYPVVNAGQPYKTVARLNDLARLGAVGRPVITTEMGWNQALIDPDVVAAHLLNGIMDSALLGDTKTYLYELYDADTTHRWGLMNPDGSPRPAGQALHNLTTMLADNSSTFTPNTLTYDITGLKGTERTLTIAKSDGSYWLAIWDETSAAHVLTVTLPTKAQQIQVYTPRTTPSAIQTVTNVSGVSINLGSSPNLIKIVPGTSVAAPSATANTVIVSKATNTTISGDATTSTIFVYGSGNTVNPGPATLNVYIFAGGNTVNGGANTSTINLTNTGNTVNVGPGATRINDSGTNNIITFNSIGGGLTDIYGYIFSQGTKLNLAPLLANTEWDGTIATIGNFLHITITGSTAMVSVTPSGTSGGMTYDIVALHGQGYLTLTSLVSNAILTRP